MHIAGLTTDMDYAATIESLIEVKGAPIETYQEEIEDLNADVTAWGDVSYYMTALNDTLDDLRGWDLWNTMDANSSDESILTATASSSADEGVYKIAVDQMAQAHSVASDSPDDLSPGADLNTDLVAAGVLTAGDQFIIEGQTITIGATESITSLQGKINTAADSMADADKVNATVIDNRLVITREETGNTRISMDNVNGTPLIDLGIIQKPTPPVGSALLLDMATNTAPVVLDSSGNGYNGAVGGGASWTASGRYEGGYDLNSATNDYIQVPTQPLLDSYDQFSMSLWVKTSSSNPQTLISYGDLGIDAGVLVRMNNGNAEVYIDDGTNSASVTDSTNLADGEWHQVTVTDDGSSLSLYVDGELANATDSSSVGVISTNISDTTQVGRRFNGGGATQYFTGTVDQAGIWNRALTENEVEDFAFSYKNELLEAQDAEFTVNGLEVTRSDNKDLTDVIQNVTLNLQGETLLGQEITLTIEHDREAAKEKINELIENYNNAAAIMDEFGSITTSGTSSNGASVDAVGELASDPLLREMERKIRTYITDAKYPYMNQINAEYEYNGQTGICDSLSDIGVWTIGQENEISLNDEERLDDMLENNFDLVAQLFRGVYDATEGGYVHGVATDFYQYTYSVTDSLSGQIASHVQDIEDKIEDRNDEIVKLTEDLETYEQQLWEEFGRMDEALQNMNSEVEYINNNLKKTS
jgi:flagellar capping protein FliD